MTAPDALLFAAAALVTALVGAWVTRPLWQGAEPLSPPDPAAVELLAQRQAILAMLRDLDAERALGRLDAAEHELLRAEAVGHGAAVLRAIDRLAEAARSASAQRLARVEADVRAARAAEEPETRRCDGCGHVTDRGDRFWARCGRPLEHGVVDEDGSGVPRARGHGD